LDDGIETSKSERARVYEARASQIRTKGSLRWAHAEYGAARPVTVKLVAMAFDRQGKIALDMAAPIESSKQDRKSVSGKSRRRARRCKTSIWAVFCH
jgi:hypothetical protein